MKLKKGRKIDWELKERINKMVQSGMSFSEIARALNLKSRQLVAYHWHFYRNKGRP